MLDPHKVAAALAAKRHLFAGHSQVQDTALDGYRQRWAAICALPRAEVDRRLAGCPWPGGRPSAEHDLLRAPVVAFEQRWKSHEQARAWARKALLGTPTIAVDGSQIAPSRDFSLPVGAVQIGWFENRHNVGGDYVKDVSFEILAPQELAGEGDGDASAFPDWQVNVRRFEGECRRLIDCMQAGRTSRPVCLFDGSLVVSFAAHMLPEHQARYVGAAQELLLVSAECRVPLVGYVDTSYAADLAAMLDAAYGATDAGRIADSAFLQPLLRWGDRTPAWICARDDGVRPLDGAKYYDQVGFVYLKTTAGNPPARLEFPRWLIDDGQLDRVVGVIRAECVVGNGYPYALETADAMAVLTTQDRERFYAAFQRFAAQEGLPLRFSRKAGSKLGRR